MELILLVITLQQGCWNVLCDWVNNGSAPIIHNRSSHCYFSQKHWFPSFKWIRNFEIYKDKILTVAEKYKIKIN